MASSSQVRHLWLRGFRDLLKERGQEERGRDAESPPELPADPVPRQPRALGRCEEERSFRGQRPPRRSPRASPCLGFPAGPGEGAREAVDGKVQRAENPREGRGQNRRSPRPSSCPCATAQEVEEAAGPVLHGGAFRDCS